MLQYLNGTGRISDNLSAFWFRQESHLFQVEAMFVDLIEGLPSWFFILIYMLLVCYGYIIINLRDFNL